MKLYGRVNGVETEIANGGGGNSGITYSLSEVKTDDVWIDGKPIYRRTIQFTRWNEQFDATSMNIDNFFVDYAHSTFAAHTSSVAYTAPFVNNGAVQLDVWYDINNKMINMRTNGLSNNTLDAAYYTILYTKTTDTGNG